MSIQAKEWFVIVLNDRVFRPVILHYEVSVVIKVDKSFNEVGAIAAGCARLSADDHNGDWLIVVPSSAVEQICSSVELRHNQQYIRDNNVKAN